MLFVAPPLQAAEHVNMLSQDHPRFPYHSRHGRLTDSGKISTYEMAAPSSPLAQNASGTKALGTLALPYGAHEPVVASWLLSVYPGSPRHPFRCPAGVSLASNFPRSFKRGSSSGIKPEPRFAPKPRAAYSPQRQDIDPYNTYSKSARDGWVRRSVRLEGRGT
eukprot:COSAG01_NODE_16985_length_1188_cov_1.593205_1_plen_162_part_10